MTTLYTPAASPPTLSCCPLLIPEIAHLVVDLIDPEDLLAVAFSCRVLFDAACGRIWRTLQPKTHLTLRRIRQALEGRHGSKRAPFYEYRQFVTHFGWCPYDKDLQPLERHFFDVFQFPRLTRLDLSYAAAQDHAVRQILTSAPRLRHVDLSLCYCLSTEAIRPLLVMSPRLETLVLYGCGKIAHDTLATVIERHADTLRCIRLTDISDRVLQSIQQCRQLDDLGLEHCADPLSADRLRLFCTALSTRPTTTTMGRLSRLRMRDVATLTEEPLQLLAPAIADTLLHLDLSECNLVAEDGFMQLAKHCRALEHLALVHQFAVTDQVIQTFILHCPHLRLLDISGCRLLTERALAPWIDDTIDTSQSRLKILNISGLEPDVSANAVLHLLQSLPHITEICLGVAYDRTDAMRIIELANDASLFSLFWLDIARCATICRSTTANNSFNHFVRHQPHLPSLYDNNDNENQDSSSLFTLN